MAASGFSSPSPWALAAETIAVKIRWFGLLIGAVLVNIAQHPPERQFVLNAMLVLGLGYTPRLPGTLSADHSFMEASPRSGERGYRPARPPMKFLSPTERFP